MTDHDHYSADGPFGNTASSEDYDPLVAGRFRVLDGIEAPPVGEVPVVRSLAARRSGRPALLVVTAAAALIVLGLSAAAMMSGGESPGLVDVVGVEPAAEAADETEASTPSLVVPAQADEAATSQPSSTADEASNGAAGGTAAENADGDAAAASRAADDASASDGASAGDGAPTGDDDGAGSTGQGTQTGAGSIGTTVGGPGSTDPFETVLPELLVLKGAVVELYTNCESLMSLHEGGPIEGKLPRTCEEGSWIVVDNVKIRTSSDKGSGVYFDKHPDDIAPGADVTVTAVRDASGDLSLSCADCGIGYGG